jgi:hypothetical protein
VATRDDVSRWEKAYTRLDSMQHRPWIFLPAFVAIGRRA